MLNVIQKTNGTAQLISSATHNNGEAQQIKRDLRIYILGVWTGFTTQCWFPGTWFTLLDLRHMETWYNPGFKTRRIDVTAK